MGEPETRLVRQGAEGATAPETLRPQDRARSTLWREPGAPGRRRDNDLRHTDRGGIAWAHVLLVPQKDAAWTLVSFVTQEQISERRDERAASWFASEIWREKGRFHEE